MRLSIEAAEHDGSGLNRIASLFESREFLRHIGGGGLAVDRCSPVGRCDFVVDLVDIAKARLDTYANHAIISAHHTPCCRFDIKLSGLYTLLLLTCLPHVAPIERFIVHSVRSRAHFIDVILHTHNGFFVYERSILVVGDTNVEMICRTSERIVDLNVTFFAERGSW